MTTTIALQARRFFVKMFIMIYGELLLTALLYNHLKNTLKIETVK